MNAPECLRLLRLPLKIDSGKSFHTSCRTLEASSRRLTKALRIPPAPYFTPSPSAKQDHIVYNPPSAAPNVHHTPLRFLPLNDPRRALYAKAAAIASTTTTMDAVSPIASTKTALATIASRIPQTASPVLPQNTALPPPVREPYQKKYHLGQSEVDEIRQLREADPVKWSRLRLAEKFDCSPFFIQTVCRNEKAQKEHWSRFNTARVKMSRGRREAREDRARRKNLWGRE